MSDGPAQDDRSADTVTTSHQVSFLPDLGATAAVTERREEMSERDRTVASSVAFSVCIYTVELCQFVNMASVSLTTSEILSRTAQLGSIRLIFGSDSVRPCQISGTLLTAVHEPNFKNVT